MLEVSVTDFAAAHQGGAAVIDVREPMEYVQGHVPGATLIPMSRFTSMLDQLPQDPFYVICASGNRSYTVAQFLARQGRTALSVSGGTHAWQMRGYPLVQGMAAG
ncbi:MAG TPA: rhodanese-like domain-containing protein [Candidatus Lustribacter sp.]|nr:rhodanese-like domain-containing protein [Candidatus Lustribacter sp.]